MCNDSNSNKWVLSVLPVTCSLKTLDPKHFVYFTTHRVQCHCVVLLNCQNINYLINFSLDCSHNSLEISNFNEVYKRYFCVMQIHILRKLLVFPISKIIKNMYLSKSWIIASPLHSDWYVLVSLFLIFSILFDLYSYYPWKSRTYTKM